MGVPINHNIGEGVALYTKEIDQNNKEFMKILLEREVIDKHEDRILIYVCFNLNKIIKRCYLI